MTADKSKWIWMPHPGHFICASDCKFFLTTYVNGYIVSTVGEMFPDEQVREIYAKSKGITLEGMGDARRFDFMKKHGFVEIGLDRLYETMVFTARKAPDEEKDGQCCPFRMVSGAELDLAGYTTATEAYRGHLEMCARWAKKRPRRPQISKDTR